METVQIAVTALDALGLNPNNLIGVQKEHTKALPGTGIPLFKPHSKHHAPIHHRHKARFHGSNPLSEVSGSIIEMMDRDEHAVPVSHGGHVHSTVRRPKGIGVGNVSFSVSANARIAGMAFLGGSRHVAVHDAVFGGHFSLADLDAVFAEGF